MEQEISADHQRGTRRHRRVRVASVRSRASPPPPPLRYVGLAERPLRRLPQLFLGLALYGFSVSFMLRASLGVNPWSVLSEGLEQRTSLSFGMISAVLGVLVLLLWIPLRQAPTFGTVANIVVVACSSDLGLLLVPPDLGLGARVGLLIGGILLNGLSVAVYVGARFGPGPRDGLMTGAATATGCSIRLVRTLIEVTVLTVGWLLGGTAGLGTVLYALTVGPIAQFFMPRFVYVSTAERLGGAALSEENRALPGAGHASAVDAGQPSGGTVTAFSPGAGSGAPAPAPRPPAARG